MTDKEITRLQELTAKTSDMAAEIKRLQEREWVGLTDEEILNLYTGITKGKWDCLMYARAIEAKLRKKNHA